MPKPRKIHPQTFLPHSLLLDRTGRLCAFVNGAEEWVGIPTPRIPEVRTRLRHYLRVLTDGAAALRVPPRQHLTLLALRQRALLPLVGLLSEQPLSVMGQFWIDEHGQQHLVPARFSSSPMELLAVAGDLLNPNARVRVRRCDCDLYAGRCGHFLVNNFGAARRGAKPHCVPAHRLLGEERLALYRVDRSRREELLTQFRNDAAAREAAAKQRRDR